MEGKINSKPGGFLAKARRRWGYYAAGVAAAALIAEGVRSYSNLEDITYVNLNPANGDIKDIVKRRTPFRDIENTIGMRIAFLEKRDYYAGFPDGSYKHIDDIKSEERKSLETARKIAHIQVEEDYKLKGGELKMHQDERDISYDKNFTDQYEKTKRYPKWWKFW